MAAIENAREGRWASPRQARPTSDLSPARAPGPRVSRRRTSDSKPTSARTPERKNIPTAAWPSSRPASAATASAPASESTATTSARRPARGRSAAASPPPRNSVSGFCLPARRAADTIAAIESRKPATAPGQRLVQRITPSPKAELDPAATEAFHDDESAPRRSRAHAGPTAVPTMPPTAAARAPTSTSNRVIRAAGQPIAARTPMSRRRAATRREKRSHSSSSPAATTKLERARNSPPNGVDPLAAARASRREASTRRPSLSGTIRPASSAATSARRLVGGTNQAVVAPNRLPASRSPQPSDTNAFGVAPWAFQ